MAEVSARHTDLADRGVLITGGGSGIGAALVEGFAAQGARVAFIDIADDASRGLAARVSEKACHPVHYLKADLSDVAAAKAAVDRAAEILGSLSVLVNNAGWDDRHDLEAVTEEYWDQSQAINLKQMFFVSQAAVPHLRKTGGGAIVNFSSIAYLLNMGEMPAYTTAKAGIVGLTKSLAGKLGPENIRVNAILPGMIVTERQKTLWLKEEDIAAMIARQCLKRVLVAEDLVGPCLFLASNASAAMTAQTVVIDGGAL
ncbi:NAD(P)-dependent dehydrogenase, short-chain alcohol dehydrogenase family [Xaviernesmea oryzae]|uniref:NAD(P)-dependent dehydrogenase, short-chain alcohol dehydrogenase family n=1 Tax=Xaviernesmea oryzae TaxID=464029 RepID=A0A1X7GJ07_9HYPH|nr:SDR family oxidoreductase [Xaviernesmea oryzae]SMF70427.1 NAD(P)-dependent dehydrogenase, short-chain alcohol dehydrogenase family [Xaviernesmea oryzae]